MRWFLANVLGAISGTLLGPLPVSIFLAYFFNKHTRRLFEELGYIDKSRFILIRATGILLTAIAKADGVYSKNELTYIKHFWKHYFQMDQNEFKWYLKDLKYVAFLPSLPVSKAIKMLNKYAHRHEKIFFIQSACEMAHTNRVVHIHQKKIIDLIALALGITPSEINKIWKKYKSSLDKYYKVLGVRPDAPIEVIRKRYYELAKFFHPDRFRHRSESEQRFAEQKMKLINEAYSNILKQKQSVN